MIIRPVTKLVVGVPSTEFWTKDFGVSMVGLGIYCATVPFPDGRMNHLILNNPSGSILPNMRSDIVQNALNADATHVLFIDSDQTFPHDLAHNLLSWRKQVVACNIATKRVPSQPTARGFDGSASGRMVYSPPGKTGLEKVWRIGCGVMLIEISVFRQIPPPWFPMVWREDAQCYHGEDWGFCELLEKYNIPIWIDHHISTQIGHVGKMVYNHEMVVQKEAKSA
jgi:hypothetical protein